ncbi:endonuclease/exonuclease/phosphatase family protein [Formicincola oecophyllae]|uniref:Endonuclease/exonuclease/phosphatase family protein n=1 Tax=Formicincola oecophyllae TaxID=2558361 RepID=A0A4Y6UBL3_9PROT|nr:endonuclease/exonuclease/phosphatase family protein [Formicincola oecophyllae]QDH13866.1 endonuclease/exonuclease/phosphatase family protein [Formicincola oecophyllae]
MGPGKVKKSLHKRQYGLIGAVLALATVAVATGPFTASAVAVPGRPDERGVKIATWNVDWLATPGEAQAYHLPDDIPHRTQHDWERLRHYASKLHADIVVLEEVGSAADVWALFNQGEWWLFMPRHTTGQNVAILVRRGVGLQPQQLGDVEALGRNPEGTHPLRPGVVVQVGGMAGGFTVLGVHLKAGCPGSVRTRSNKACAVLERQFRVLAQWALGQQAQGQGWVMAGDFNRRLAWGDPLLAPLAAGPLKLTTAGMASPCRQGERFIDHIILGGAMAGRLKPGSQRVMLYRDDPPGAAGGLSDHCPLSAKLLPAPAALAGLEATPP